MRGAAGDRKAAMMGGGRWRARHGARARVCLVPGGARANGRLALSTFTKRKSSGSGMRGRRSRRGRPIRCRPIPAARASVSVRFERIEPGTRVYWYFAYVGRRVIVIFMTMRRSRTFAYCENLGRPGRRFRWKETVGVASGVRYASSHGGRKCAPRSGGRI
ncbi:hypothetical protein [Burkholderia pseudomallei]|uniref:hypothetical protein n=1 Tax=Burkholderia pseudomallei TaxID=28450 RepID=UPI000572345D|nr:hypothetical protein [Burkholderia pseudomallei]